MATWGAMMGDLAYYLEFGLECTAASALGASKTRFPGAPTDTTTITVIGYCGLGACPGAGYGDPRLKPT